MKKAICGAVALVAIGAASALAADLPAAPVYAKTPAVVAAPVYNWTGFYVGANAGGAWGNFDPTTSTVFFPAGIFAASSVPAINTAGLQTIKPNGFTGGLEAGYNWQVSHFVLGVEGDIESFRLSGGAVTGPVVYPCCAPTNFTVASNASTSWLATARGRAGYAVDNWLFFGTGGAAFTNLRGTFAFTDTFYPSAEAAAISSTRLGYAVGGGVEAGFWGNWSVKAEYLYVNFGTVAATGFDMGTAFVNAAGVNNPFTHSIDLKANIVRVGVNYRFGGPVVARY